MQQAQAVPELAGRRILMGVTGSIAAYKAAELASGLTQSGAQVDVLLSESAQRFVAPLTFQALTGRRAWIDHDLWGQDAHIVHVELARQADVLLVAPATATTLARLAMGLADTLIGLVSLACTCPLVLAPAMDAGMYQHPATQRNVAILRERGAILAGPVEGRMASGEIGIGRMMDPEGLIGVVRWVLGRSGPLAGRKLVVTAGGTQEPLDPVRAITNRSSGKQGYALAQAALDRGAEVTLISAPVNLTPPYGARLVTVMTAAEMGLAVKEAVREADVLLMAAAVADFQPRHTEVHKIKRGEGARRLELEPTQDILAEVAQQRQATGRPKVMIGFAAESQNVAENAREKLARKGLSMIIANDITASDAGFGVDTNRVILIGADGETETLPLLTKVEVAGRVLDRVVHFLSSA
jgi:phosphopantothenoylcysteine decarboxylase/phosphopantothenate--cysteine ligase